MRNIDIRKFEVEFDKLVDVQKSGCWNWKGLMVRNAFPMFYVGRNGKDLSISARRFAFYKEGVPLVSDNSEIWNQCGNICCVNPSHQIENTLENRFRLLVDVGKADDCWNWKGSKTKGGYGNFENSKAHRIAYKLSFGDFPKLLDVLHKCDNPSCCNPKHLFLGTHAENMRDMVAKGRSKRGEQSGKHKLKESDVRIIKKRLSIGESPYSIHKDFGVSISAIQDIQTGRTWSWMF